MLTLAHLSFDYDTRPVFAGLSLSFGAGWTALTGANGSGKSTLVKLISGELKPSGGAITGNKGVLVCPQTSEPPPECFFSPDTLNSSEFFYLAARLSIGDDWAGRWETLSEGEKKRCMIAGVLIQNPRILILDEPANHIDAQTMELLKSALQTFSGTGIIVSHNIDFLDELAVSTVLLAAGNGASRAFVYDCPPRRALAEFEKFAKGSRERKAALAQEARKLETAHKDAVREAAQDKQKRMSKKNLDKHDSDTRQKINLARLSGRDAAGGKKAASVFRALCQKEAELGESSLEVSAMGMRKTGAGLNGEKSSRLVLFFREEGKITLPCGALSHPALEIKNDSRIIISGANGAGKTSLLNYIANAVKNEKLPCWYLPQELNEADCADALEKLKSLGKKEMGDALSIVYRLGSEPRALLATKRPSPGEARKVLFALAMLQSVQIILLDEPANHIDAVSQSAFAEAVNEFEGAAVIITHDTVFAQKTGKDFWHIEQNGAGRLLTIERRL